VALLRLSIHTGLLVGCSPYIPTVNVLFIALCGDVRFDAGQPEDSATAVVVNTTFPVLKHFDARASGRYRSHRCLRSRVRALLSCRDTRACEMPR
jgi:hypothetical protein